MAPNHPRVGDKWLSEPQNAINYNSNHALDIIYEKLINEIKIIPKNVFELGNGKFKILYTPKDFETASTPDMLTNFKDQGIEAIPQSNALFQRTILVRKLDKYITATDSNALKATLNDLNNFHTQEVQKLPGKDHVIKLVLGSLDDVKKAKNNGIRFRYTIADPEHIHSETKPYRATICLKCYKINMHSTAQ